MHLRLNPHRYERCFLCGMQNIQTSDPIPHVNQVRERLHELLSHLREDAEKVSDPSAAALFETSAEVLAGLEHAFEHFAQKSEAAWRK